VNSKATTTSLIKNSNIEYRQINILTLDFNKINLKENLSKNDSTVF
jgi:hypothetical protein